MKTTATRTRTLSSTRTTEDERKTSTKKQDQGLDLKYDDNDGPSSSPCARSGFQREGKRESVSLLVGLT